MEDQAPFFEMPNEVSRMAHAPAYYGNQYVPKPNNTAAMKVDASAVMRAVREAK
jgi:hypothetical protein